MTYPSLEQYNEALQHPQLALLDPVFKSASIAKTGLGQPLALCGGFALTYTVTAGGQRYAVRCFHKQSNGLETRYSAIATELKSLKSPYFLDFEFQPRGVRIGKGEFPVVKMAWASGTTLGEYLAKNFRDPAALDRLDGAMTRLAAFLEDHGLAHGDVQPGNVMVAADGSSVQLIDYDGMFVPALRSLGSAELGLRNFQHPRRTASTWDATLDRFSFATIALAIRALKADPSLWQKYQADENSLLFKANDFAAPVSSRVLADLGARPGLDRLAKDFASICAADFAAIPSLADYLAGRNIPTASVALAAAPAEPARYLSAFQVLPADFALCLRSVGDRIELIGKITDVRRATTRYGLPYVFLNFGDWRGDIVKINIWSEGLAALTTAPDQSWVGKWISVTGLMEPIFRGQQGYRHLSLTVTQSNQMHVISHEEATYRLAGTSSRSGTEGVRPGNQAVLEAIQGGPVKSPPGKMPPPTTGPPKTPNQILLEQMQASQGNKPATPPRYVKPGPAPQRPPYGTGPKPTTASPRRTAPDAKTSWSLSWPQIVVALAAVAVVAWFIYTNVQPH